MTKLIKTTSVAVLLGTSLSIEAALVDWGARAVTSVADCPSFCNNFDFGPTLGGVGTASTGISEVNDSFRGNARASAALSGGLSTPVLKAESFTDAGFHGAFGTAFAVQGYTYNGTGETLVLDISLDGIVDDPETDASETRAFLEVVLYGPQDFAFTSSRPTLEAEFGASPLTQSASAGGGEASLFLQLDYTNPSFDSGQISIDVTAGQEFYLWAWMRSEAESGIASTSADAFNTGVMSFQGNPNLVAASAAVIPVPAAAWLFGSGMLFLAGAARRRKN